MGKFSFDIRKLKFEAQEPDKETRVHLVIILVFALFLAGIICLTMKEAALSVLIPVAGKKVLGFIHMFRNGKGP